MIWIFIFLGLCVSSARRDLLGITADFSMVLQKNCAELVPNSLTHQHFAQSFLCGVPLREPQALEVFRQTSLLHLMVVSGSHLQIVSFFFLMLFPKKFHQKISLRFLLWSALAAYCLVTGFQAPVVRAFMSRLLSSLSRSFSWNWDAGKSHLIAGILLLFLMPDWIFSFSFYLSWLASLGFLLTPLSQIYERRNKLNRWLEALIACALIQTFMAVFFSQFSFLGLLMNALFAPLIGLCLLPLSALAVVFPFCIPLADSGWDFLLWLLTKTVSIYPLPLAPQVFPETSSLHWIFLWSFLAALHCFFELLRRYRYQRSYV